MPTATVKWAELFRKEFLEKIEANPVVYLPMGLCEPHGHIAVLGLDTLKAEWLCEEAARRWGGIVAPTQGYQIHEVGYHAPWLAEVAGNTNACMSSMPTAPILYFFLYQLRAFHNAGFKHAIVISGHAGGNQEDLRMAAKSFMQQSDMLIEVFSDPELTAGKYAGDHAGKYEISQLLYLRPDCIDLSRIDEWQKDKSSTRFAQGEDAIEASAGYGRQIMEDCLSGINDIIRRNPFFETGPAQRALMPYQTVEQVWQELKSRSAEWITTSLKPGQLPAGKNSIWKPFEDYRVQ
jgi:creatinine amidohydrolase